MGDIGRERRIIDRVRQNYSSAEKMATQEKKSLSQEKEIFRLTKEAASILQSVAQAVQHKIHTRVAGVVSKCLASVFENPYEFRIDFNKKRGKTEARPVFVRDGHDLDPLDGCGGGVLDVAAFALRVVCLVLKQPERRKLLVCDEPFKNVNGEGNRRRCAEMVTTLAQEFGLQIILTTGYEWLKIGKVIDLSEIP